MKKSMVLKLLKKLTYQVKMLFLVLWI